MIESSSGAKGETSQRSAPLTRTLRSSSPKVIGRRCPPRRATRRHRGLPTYPRLPVGSAVVFTGNVLPHAFPMSGACNSARQGKTRFGQWNAVFLLGACFRYVKTRPAVYWVRYRTQEVASSNLASSIFTSRGFVGTAARWSFRCNPYAPPRVHAEEWKRPKTDWLRRLLRGGACDPLEVEGDRARVARARGGELWIGRHLGDEHDRCRAPAAPLPRDPPQLP